MTCSKIEQFWIKTKPLDTLKVLNLYNSDNLRKIGGFSGIPNLKILVLEQCKRLVKIHESVRILKRLVVLNLRYCISLMQLPNSICDLTSLKTLHLDGCSKLERLPERFGDIPRLEDISVSEVMKYSESEPTKLWDFLFGRFSKKKINPIAFMLPSFSTLSSLKQLDLSDCNLSEEVIPTDLGGFPSLETLNLSGNGFVNIPTNLIQLFKLQKVCFINCKRLRVLPDLPSSITCLRVDGCSSLEAFPNPCQKLTFKPWMLTFVNCFKLNDTRGAFAWLRSYLYFLLYSNRQGICCMEYDFTMLLPGSRIPDCFNHQEDDSSLKLQLPQNWCENKWMGFLICALFGPDGSSGSSQNIYCQLLAGPDLHNFIFQDATEIYLWEGTRINSDQLCLIFIPRDNTKSLDWWKSLNHFEVSFSPHNLKVKRCGLRLVHEEDIEEFVQCTNYKRPSENNQLVASSSDQDYCIVNGNEGRESEVEEPSGSSNSVGESPYKVPSGGLTSMITEVYSSKRRKTVKHY
ncbi:hypothetical protein K2173_011909 [Erythroxylum novogranatense]|uniref:C-JID domain-containing protein n=1 Tax=Erythroxylum novogranatense TaxID=1862640 RepID=A0AAV8TGC7_9ROSI|nr:hypothetical protein K2173_011909 [Erythroxylum novogranatense]